MDSVILLVNNISSIKKNLGCVKGRITFVHLFFVEKTLSQNDGEGGSSSTEAVVGAVVVVVLLLGVILVVVVCHRRGHPLPCLREGQENQKTFEIFLTKRKLIKCNFFHSYKLLTLFSLYLYTSKHFNGSLTHLHR